MEKEDKISEGQTGFRPNRSCVDSVYRLGKGNPRKERRGANNVLFLSRCTDGQKAYDTAVC